MTLLSGENVSRRISESRPGSGKEAKESKGKKEGKKESGTKKKKRPAAEGKETDTDANVRTVRTQKNPEAFLPQGLG